MYFNSKIIQNKRKKVAIKIKKVVKNLKIWKFFNKMLLITLEKKIVLFF